MNEFYESYGIAKIDWETRLKIKELASSRGLTAGQFMTNAINQYAIQFSFCHLLKIAFILYFLFFPYYGSIS